jgi:uncharacterized protein YbdZ (MbtH family)
MHFCHSEPSEESLTVSRFLPLVEMTELFSLWPSFEMTELFSLWPS